MKVIGLTGGIASGKSVVSSMIKELGYQVIDTDLIARDLLTNNNEVISEVRTFFPKCYDDETKQINRHRLAEIIFNDETKRKVLNSIIHPRVKNAVLSLIKTINEEYVFIDVPLLYEASFSTLCDEVIVVYITYEIQLERLMKRDRISKQYAHQKITSQMNLEEKKNLADYVIDNNGSIKQTNQQLIEIIKQIKKKG